MALVGLLAASTPTLARDDFDTLPMLGLAIYDIYRVQLLVSGWEPLPSDFAYEDGFPEVSCGNRVCIADWSMPDGGTISFTLWPFYTPDDRLLLLMPPEAEYPE